MKPTLKQVAATAQVSLATASNALNRRKGVGDEVRERVLRAAQELGYTRVSPPARAALRLIVCKRHGMVVADTPFFAELIEGLERESRARGYDLAVSHFAPSGPDRQELARLLAEDHAEGFIVLATEMLPEDLECLSGAQRPVILLDSRFRDCPYDSILINNTDAAYKATRHLLGLGHTRIGYLHSSVYINNFRDREAGYTEALRQAGIEPEGRYRLDLEPTPEGSWRDMRDALARMGPLKGDALPTAFFADNDILAYGAMKAMQEQGVHLPEDVSVVGLDDMPFCEMTRPRLSTVRVFKHELGGLAVRRLAEKIAGDTTVLTIEAGTELVRRESDQPPRS
ncbi:MAG: LacI family DNA-binding transcriptional regulator [Clostridia bacterium]|nr:LacI family DNA-binding transcriptional regulator [Clostridia bacterium]